MLHSRNSFRSVFFLLGDSLAFELFVSTLWNNLFQLHGSCILFARPVKMEWSVPKCRHIKFRLRRITKTKEYNTHNTAKLEIKSCRFITLLFAYLLLYMQEIKSTVVVKI
jgi:hypothetical protein